MNGLSRTVFAVLLLFSLFVLNRCEESSALPNSESKSSLEAPVTPNQPQEVVNADYDQDSLSNVVYITLISLSCVIGVIGLVCAGVCWYRAHTMSGLAKRTDYPAYGITGPNPLHEQSYEPPIDRSLNRNAEIYHYNQTKKKMKVLTSSATSESSTSSKSHEPYDVAAELEINDEETSDGEYTVYECSGFASTVDGPMEIKNPLFDDMEIAATSNGRSFYTTSDNQFATTPTYISNRRNSTK